MSNIKIAILGADGKMGRMITQNILNDPDLQIISAYTMDNSPNIGQDIGALVGKGKIGVIIENTNTFSQACKDHKMDIIIDFTIADATEKQSIIAIENGIPIVVGTTGLSDDFTSKFIKLCEEKKCSAVIGTNFATGVNIFFKLAEIVAQYVKGWDIEIIESHHHHKKDSPSGTAMTTAENIAKVLHQNLTEIVKYGREGYSPRQFGEKEIGIHSIRAGDIIGDHTVLYAGTGERIELTHRAHNREGYAAGSITAAKYLYNHGNEGRIIKMPEILKI